MSFPFRPFPETIDSTMRGAFVACPHKFFLEYFHHWKPRGESVDLHAGKAFAAGLETARRAFHQHKLSAEESLFQGVKALKSSWGWFIEPDGHVKSLDRMIGALVYYFDVFGWATDHIQPLMINDAPAVEFSFALPIPHTRHPDTGQPIIYTGRFDMLGLYNKQIFVVDEKTTKQLGPTWNQNWTHRSQITGYNWAAREYGHIVAGGIIRGISILKTKYGHAESIQFRPDWMVDRWLLQLTHDINRMIDCWRTGYWDYDLDTACTHYGGCMFQTTCGQQDELRILQNDFVQRVWDPLAREEKPLLELPA